MRASKCVNRRELAYHEAAHAVAAYSQGSHVERIELYPRNPRVFRVGKRAPRIKMGPHKRTSHRSALGSVVHQNRLHGFDLRASRLNTQTRRRAEAEAIIALAGAMGELLSEHRNPARHDLPPSPTLAQIAKPHAGCDIARAIDILSYVARPTHCRRYRRGKRLLRYIDAMIAKAWRLVWQESARVRRLASALLITSCLDEVAINAILRG